MWAKTNRWGMLAFQPLGCIAGIEVGLGHDAKIVVMLYVIVMAYCRQIAYDSQRDCIMRNFRIQAYSMLILPML